MVIRKLLGRFGESQLLLIVLSSVAAAGFIAGEVVDPRAVGGPLGWVFVVLFLLNSGARLWLHRRL